MESCLWLEQKLATYKRILVLISHSQDFMNEVSISSRGAGSQRGRRDIGKGGAESKKGEPEPEPAVVLLVGARCART